MTKTLKLKNKFTKDNVIKFLVILGIILSIFGILQKIFGWYLLIIQNQ